MSENVDGPPPEAVDRPARRPWLPISLLSVAGAAAIAGGAVAIKVELDREPTPRQVTAAGEKEMAERWRIMDAGELFPARVESPKAPNGGTAGRTALRVGIAPATSCAEGFDRRLADILVKYGCRTALRATYVDGDGALAATIGVAVMPDAKSATSAETGFRPLGANALKEKYGVRTVSFPGTVVKDFGDSLRQDFWFDSNGTQYLFFRANGWLTPRGPKVKNLIGDTFAFSETVMNQVALHFTDLTEPCERRGVRC